LTIAALNACSETPTVLSALPPSVCPEPVLANNRFSSPQNWRQKQRFPSAAFLSVSGTVFLSHLYIKKSSFYQDRLGTNIGKTPKKASFVDVSAPEGSTAPDRGGHSGCRSIGG
jgi:hypothetical protein